MTARIGIVHHSSTGYTTLLADAVARGVTSEGAETVRVQVASSDIRDGRYDNEAQLTLLDACDGIVLGCPTYMGSVSAQMKAFLDASLSRWYAQTWSGKVGAAFTVSSTPSGDKLNALFDLFVFAMQHGMVWTGLNELPLGEGSVNRLGVYVGVAAQPDYRSQAAALIPGDAAAGERLGARVAQISRQLRG